MIDEERRMKMLIEVICTAFMEFARNFNLN
jgi:hypothetical protein